MADIFQILYDLIVLTVVLCLLLILLYQEIKLKRDTPQFITAFAFFFLYELSLFLRSLIPDSIPPQFLSATLVIAFFFIYLHYELISNIRPPYWRFGLMCGISIVDLVLLAFNYIGVLNLNEIQYESLFSSLMMVLYLIGFGIGILSTYRSHKLLKEYAIKIELFALLLVVGAQIVIYARLWYLIIFENTVTDSNPLFRTLIHRTSIFQLIGLLIILINYVLHANYIYRLPFPIYELMFYNSVGVLVYNRNVEAIGIKPLQIEADLLSGALTAISALIRANLGKDAKLKVIDAKGHRIFFSHLLNNQGTLVIITSHGSYFLRKALDRFVKTIPENLNIEMNKKVVDTKNLQNKIDMILNETFPWLVLSSES